MPFDPSKPFEVIGATEVKKPTFDSSKPFEAIQDSPASAPSAKPAFDPTKPHAAVTPKELADDPDFDPIAYLAQNPDDPTTAEEAAWLQYQKPVTVGGAMHSAGKLVKGLVHGVAEGVPSMARGFLKGGENVVKNVAASFQGKDETDPDVARRMRENAAGVELGTTSAMKLVDSARYNLNKIGAEGGYTRQEVVDHIHQQAALLRQMQEQGEGKISTDVEDPTELPILTQAFVPALDQPQFKTDEERRQFEQNIQDISEGPGDPTNLPIIGQITAPAALTSKVAGTVLKGGGKAVEAAAGTVEKGVKKLATSKVAKLTPAGVLLDAAVTGGAHTGAAATAAAGAGATWAGSKMAGGIGRIAREAGDEILGAAPARGQSFYRKVGKEAIKGAAIGTTAAAPMMIGAENAEEAGAMLGPGAALGAAHGLYHGASQSRSIDRQAHFNAMVQDGQNATFATPEEATADATLMGQLPKDAQDLVNYYRGFFNGAIGPDGNPVRVVPVTEAQFIAETGQASRGVSLQDGRLLINVGTETPQGFAPRTAKSIAQVLAHEGKHSMDEALRMSQPEVHAELSKAIRDRFTKDGKASKSFLEWIQGQMQAHLDNLQAAGATEADINSALQGKDLDYWLNEASADIGQGLMTGQEMGEFLLPQGLVSSVWDGVKDWAAKKGVPIPSGSDAQTGALDLPSAQAATRAVRRQLYAQGAEARARLEAREGRKSADSIENRIKALTPVAGRTLTQQSTMEEVQAVRAAQREIAELSRLLGEDAATTTETPAGATPAAPASVPFPDQQIVNDAVQALGVMGINKTRAYALLRQASDAHGSTIGDVGHLVAAAFRLHGGGTITPGEFNPKAATTAAPITIPTGPAATFRDETGTERTITGTSPDPARVGDIVVTKGGEIRRVTRTAGDTVDTARPIDPLNARGTKTHKAGEFQVVNHDYTDAQNSAEDVKNALGGMAMGATDALYDSLIAKLQKGDLTEAGAPSQVLQKAKPLFDSGAIKTAADLKSWVQNGQKPISNEPIPQIPGLPTSPAPAPSGNPPPPNAPATVPQPQAAAVAVRPVVEPELSVRPFAGGTFVIVDADGNPINNRTYRTEASAQRAIGQRGQAATFGLPPSANGNDIVDAIIEQGGVNVSGMLKEERDHEFPHKGAWRNALITDNPNLTPDEVARLIQDDGHGDGDQRTMFRLIGEAIEARKNLRDDTAREEKRQKAASRQSTAEEKQRVNAMLDAVHAKVEGELAGNNRIKEKGRKERINAAKLEALTAELGTDPTALHVEQQADGTSIITGDFEPGNAIHEAIAEIGGGMSRGAADKLVAMQEAKEKPVYIRYRSALSGTEGDGGAGTADLGMDTRRAEYDRDPAATRKEGSIQHKVIIPLGTEVTSTGKVVSRFFTVDNLLHNAASIFEGLKAIGRENPFGRTVDEQQANLVSDANTYAENHAHGYRGDGSGPMASFPDSGLPAADPTYKPYTIPKDRFDVLNMAMHSDRASKLGALTDEVEAKRQRVAEAANDKERAQRQGVLDRLIERHRKSEEAYNLADFNQRWVDHNSGETNQLRQELRAAGFDTGKQFKSPFETLSPEHILDINETPIPLQEGDIPSVRPSGMDVDPALVVKSGRPIDKAVAAGFMPEDAVQRAKDNDRRTKIRRNIVGAIRDQFKYLKVEIGGHHDDDQYLYFSDYKNADGFPDQHHDYNSLILALPGGESPVVQIVELWTREDQRGSGKGEKLISDIATALQKQRAKMQVPVDASKGFWQHMVEKHPQWWGNSTQREGAQFNFMPDTEQDRASAMPRGFYSALQRVIEEKMPNSALPAQAMAIARQGTKAEELKWSGVDDVVKRLAEENGGKVPKAKLLEYLQTDGAVRFEEKILSNENLRSNSQAVDEAYQKGKQEAEAAGIPNEDYRKGWGTISNTTPEGMNEELSYMDPKLQDILKRNHAKFWQVGESPKFDAYTLPGGKNYREVILTLPIKRTDKQIGKENVWQGFARARMGTDYADLHPDLQAVVRADTRHINEPEEHTPETFKSTHFPKAGDYVAHMRLADHVDATGADGLLIEEIQSDRHQQGRDKGYKSDNIEKKESLRIAAEAAEDKMRSARKAVEESSPTGDIRDATDRTLIREFQDASSELSETVQKYRQAKEEGIPDAPLRKTWHEYQFRRAMADAVATGKKWIGWTTGETQADRFDLSKQVKQVDAKKYGPDRYEIAVLDNYDNEVSLPKESFTAQELADTVGNELAQKIVSDLETSQPGRVKNYRGLDLKVGGEGMKGFYDGILPKYVANYVKKWGGKVENGKIKGADDFDAWFQENHGDQSDYDEAQIRVARKEYGAQNSTKTSDTPIWKVEITPEIKKAVEAGQPMFMPDTPPEGESQGEALAREAQDAGIVLSAAALKGLVQENPATMERIRGRIQEKTGDLPRYMPEDDLREKLDAAEQQNRTGERRVTPKALGLPYEEHNPPPGPNVDEQITIPISSLKLGRDELVKARLLAASRAMEDGFKTNGVSKIHVVPSREPGKYIVASNGNHRAAVLMLTQPDAEIPVTVTRTRVKAPRPVAAALAGSGSAL